LAGVGKGLTKILTVELVEGQVPLEIVHTNVFVPVISPVTIELLRVGVVTVEVPVITVHIPVPKSGILAAKAVESLQRF
jgi:hypothetical protein